MNTRGVDTEYITILGLDDMKSFNCKNTKYKYANIATERSVRTELNNIRINIWCEDMLK